MERENMNIVIVGHVDHGKSTLVGRLLADTGVLGTGKIEKVKAICQRQGKLFEYAFLLDALEAEQDQGITIDAARIFFHTAKREYIIIDAPGHIEFLKNMVTGAARAEAAILLIDAKEGVRENSRRHGYLMSMLGVRQIVVAVNKMDLVDYDRRVFETIVAEYTAFLGEVGLTPRHFIPIAARDGDLIVDRSPNLPWYDGPSVLQALDEFEKAPRRSDLKGRLPVQDVYKFNVRGDDRRIIAGRVESGKFRVGDEVLFSPSNKHARIETIEAFNAPERTEITAGQSVGITLDQQIFVGRGEVMTAVDQAPEVSTRLRVNLFWLGKSPMVPDRSYKLKLATASPEVRIFDFVRVLDASDLATSDKKRVDRHDVAELILQVKQPIAFDPSDQVEGMGRFVIVDGYDIAGGGIVRAAVDDGEKEIRLASKIRDLEWVRGDVDAADREARNGHPGGLVMLTGAPGTGKRPIARALEAALVHSQHQAYLLDGKNVVLGVDADISLDDRGELVRRFGEVSHILADAGLIVVSTTNVIGLGDHRSIATMLSPFRVFIAHLGPVSEGLPEGADLRLNPNTDPAVAVVEIREELARRGFLRRT